MSNQEPKKVSEKYEPLAPDNAIYRALPELSPYVSQARYSNTKEVHKFYARQISPIASNSDKKKVIDVGCGNGELIYFLKSTFPNWTYKGIDKTPEFIQCARNFPGLSEVQFEVGNLFELTGQYDIVLCTGVLQIFSEFAPPLEKLISLANNDAWIFCDGLFNKWDVEARLQYCDNSNPDAAGLWRTDWNQHSRKLVSQFLRGRIANFRFIDIEMDLDLRPNLETHINQFTFRDSAGHNVITNGTNLLLNKTMLIIQK